jgi:hypothetical protein
LPGFGTQNFEREAFAAHLFDKSEISGAKSLQILFTYWQCCHCARNGKIASLGWVVAAKAGM